MYRVKKGAPIVAVRQDGETVAKTATKTKLYPDALELGQDLIFQIKPGSIYREFIVPKEYVQVLPNITNVPDGTHAATVGWGDDTEYVDIRLATDPDHESEFLAGKQIISMDGIECAHLDEFGGLHIWKPFREEEFATKVEQALFALQERFSA